MHKLVPLAVGATTVLAVAGRRSQRRSHTPGSARPHAFVGPAGRC
jgi:hypothetical protein